MPDAILERAAALCINLKTDGLRGQLTLMRAARALAAFEGAKRVTDDHLKRMAAPSLRHRLRRNPLDETGSTTRINRAVSRGSGRVSRKMPPSRCALPARSTPRG